ncbi:hypothetical protein DY000_02040350 [Brassica cretica]|uniref:Uncharacterized protein n=1 Tax=Brassica cretica TaxID=69181 RepID=A0ABQ7BP06_BRACR|nr:hypothetical protein DY000_02040350 [Brassica cretica]
MSDVPPSSEPQKKKKKRRIKKKSTGELSENADEPIEQEEEDAREEELQPEEGASEAEASGGRNDEEGVSEGEELETSLNAAHSGGSEEDSEGSPLLIRRGNDEDDGERRSPVLTSPRERTPVPIGGGAVHTGTSSRGAAILRRAPGFSFPDKVDFHYEGPAPLVYVPEKCGEFLCQLRGRAKPLPAVKDLIFGSVYEEAARAKLLGDSTMNVVIDKYDTALKGALDELELAKKEFAEKEEVSARQLNESRANLQKLNGMMTRTVARRDEFKAALESSRRIESLEVRSLAALDCEWRSDLPTVLPIRTKRLDIFPRDIQKQVTEAKRMGSLPDLSAILAAQLGLTSGEGPSMAVPRADEVFPSDGRSAGKGKKRKRGDGSGVERSTEETSDVPPSGEPQKKKKKRRTKKKSAGEQLENADEPLEQEEEDAREEELQPEEGASEAEASEGRNDEEGVSEGEERETSLNAVCSGDSEEDSEGSPLLIRKRNDEDDDERRSPVLTSPRERTPVPVGGGAVQTGTSSRGAAILRRALGFSFPDKVDFYYERPAPLVYVPEKCGEFLCQLRRRAKPLPAVKDLIFGGEYEEAVRAKLLGDSTMNVVIDKYDTALKGALDELELAKKEFAEKEEVSARQLNESRANL